MQDGALDDPLEAQGRLGIDIVLAGNRRGVLVDEIGQVLAQHVDLAATGTQGLCRGRIVQKRQEKMLNGDELMALLPGFDKSHVQADF